MFIRLFPPRGIQLLLCIVLFNTAWSTLKSSEDASVEVVSNASLLLSPATNTSFPISSTVPFLVKGSNPNVSRVGIFVDSEFVTFAPRDGSNDFSFAIGGLASGHHTIGYSAYDSGGDVVESSASNVFIQGQNYGTFPVVGGRVAVETEQYENQITRGEDFWVKRTAVRGFSLSGYMETIDDDGTRVTEGYSQTTSELRYKLYFERPGTYYLWYRGFGTANSQNSVHFGLEGQELIGLRDVGFNQYNQWVWANLNGSGAPASFTIPSPGEYDFNLWMREDGTKVDKFVLTDDANFQPSESGNRGEGRLVNGVRFEASVLLSGAVDGASMRSALVQQNLLPDSSGANSGFQVKLHEEYFASNQNLVDWIQIECRTQLFSQASDFKMPAFLTKEGKVVNPDGSSMLICPAQNSDAYFIKINHRNHLSIITKERIVSADAGLVELDFINNPALAYENAGPAQRNTSIGYGMWSGDVNGDGVIAYAGSNNDRVLVLEATGGPTPFDQGLGYQGSDLNLDGFIRYAGSNNDRVLVLENAGGPTPFDRRFSQVP